MAFYDNLTLEKGMYGADGQAFTKTLEALDPSAAYKGTELEHLDAFERQLKRFNIRVKGRGSDCVEKFFQSSQSAALFPEYVRRSVGQGAKTADMLGDLIAAHTKIDAMDYRPLTSVVSTEGAEEGAEGPSLVQVGEGAEIPATEIKMQKNLVKLHKTGRMLVSSYEAIRFERLDLFTVTLRQIGAMIAKSQLKHAVDVLINGDGNDNAAETVNVTTAGSVTYADLIQLWSKFEDFEMNRMIVSPDVMQKLLAIEELKNPVTGLNFQATGRLSTPLGAALYRASSVPAGKLIALDKNCALEMVTAADISIEYDKLIDRQLERAAITSIAGFAKIFKEASVVLNV